MLNTDWIIGKIVALFNINNLVNSEYNFIRNATNFPAYIITIRTHRQTKKQAEAAKTWTAQKSGK